MIVVPTQSIQNQTLQVSLGGQACQLNIYQNAYGLFMDVIVGGVAIVTGVICQNLNRIVRDTYFGFLGDLAWFDTAGDDDPIYYGLGSRWLLYYLDASEVAQIGH